MPAPSSRRSKTQQDIALAAARQAVREFASSKAFKETVKETLTTTLESLGIDTEHPDRTRRDMIHLRTWREMMEFIKTKGIGTTVSYIVGGAIAALVVGIGVMLSNRG